MVMIPKEKLLAIAREGRTAAESSAWLRVALGLVYLAGLIKPENIDFKKVDKEFNRFLYHALGKGHSITSVLQFMSGEQVVPVVESPRFLAAFAQLDHEVPVDTIAFLLSLNLGVAKKISGIDIAGPVLDWIERQKGADPFT
jgi:hypothetical protein